VENLVIGNVGQTIYGDYVGMPEWLAKVAAIAYPSRSIEGWPDVETNTGHQYRAVVSAVSLLGVEWPGVSTLEDLPLYYGSEIPSDVIVKIDGEEVAHSLLAAKNGGGMEPGERIKAAVDIDLVERAFYTEVARGDDYWWWIRAERFDDSTGLQLIVDCDDGTLMRMPVSVNGSDISFGDPIEVTEEYPDKAPVAATAFVAGMALADRASGADVLIHASRADTSDRPAIRATQEGEVQMDEATRRSLATRLGLDPETATEDEVNSRIDELRAEAPEEPTGDDTPTGGEDEEQDDTPAAVEQQPEPVAASNGVVSIDAEQLARLQAGAATAERLEQERIATADGSFITDAIKAGKFSPSRREHYETMMKADREGTRQLIDGLFEGTIPVHERGAAGGTGEVAGGGEADGGLLGMDASLDRDITASRERVATGHKRVTQAQEG
jgi:hypothetical protein